MSYKIVSTCIGCTACTKRCPTEAITGERNSIHIIDPELCIGCGCELCINICPFDALELDTSGEQVGDFFGVARVIEKRCTGCRLCEDACGWNAIYIAPPRPALKKRLYQSVELLETAETAAG